MYTLPLKSFNINLGSFFVYLSEDGNRRGGFRNLLLDGWWLEFWEIILFVAGDVERNPGPRRVTGMYKFFFLGI